MSRSAPSFALRAAAAVALLVGFYALALGITLALLAIPVMELMYTDRIIVRLWFFCGLGAWAIVNAVLPRRDRFEAPGPRITQADQPRLFAVLSAVARDTGQAMPAEVYLIPEANAWVSQRGGIMGIGSRRVMGLGLPLMQALTVDQMRAVIAHEFGHFHGGDTALGPWIYRTRAGVDRTLAGLHHHSRVLAAPFRWYGRLFMRITQALSRAQEYAADALGARVAGPRAMIGGLKASEAAGRAYPGFWRNEFAPALDGGVRPPMAAGLQRYMQAEDVAVGLREAVEKELREGRSDPHDSHPSLRERIEALRGIAVSSAAAEDATPALSLLDDLEGCEARLVASVLKPEWRDKVQPAEWSEMAERVWMPYWRTIAQKHAHRLRGRTVASLADFSGRATELPVAMSFVARADLAHDGDVHKSTDIIAATLLVALHAAGWAITAEPGEQAAAERDGLVLHPFLALRDLADGTMSGDAWRALCDAAGLAGLDLGTAAEAAAVAA